MSTVKKHWEDWSKNYGTSLRATTKSSTSKALEIDCLIKRFHSIGFNADSEFSALEMGCGNGHNCFALSSHFPRATFYGADFVSEMISNAKETQALEYANNNLTFFEANVLDPESFKYVSNKFDVIFTDRCLINLETTENQCKGITNLAGLLKERGWIIMIENSTTTHGNQNHCRELLGLNPRPVAEYNFFFREDLIMEHMQTIGLELQTKEDFSSLHDLLLYVLIPSINGNVVDYDHPLVQAAAKLSMNYSQQSAFGNFGQNRLFVLRKV